MPERLSPEEIDHWITVNGKRRPIPKDQKTSKPSSETKKEEPVKNQKDKFIKETKKSYVQRYDIIKSPFKINDNVYFDEFKKSGILKGFDGAGITKILSNGKTYTLHMNDIFKASETVGGMHWDTISIRNRVELLNKSNISQNYLNMHWSLIPNVIQDKIKKGMAPAGYGGISTTSGGVWNPVNDNKTITERIAETEQNAEKDDDENDEKRKDI